MKKFEVPIEKGVTVPLPDEVLVILDLKEGDSIRFELNDQGQVVILKDV